MRLFSGVSFFLEETDDGLCIERYQAFYVICYFLLSQGW